MKTHILPRLLLLIGLAAFLLPAIQACMSTSAAEPEADKPAEKVKGYHVVYLNNGREYWGRVDAIENGVVKFTHVSGEKSEYRVEEVKVVTFQKKRLYHDIDNVQNLPDKRYKKWLKDPLGDFVEKIKAKIPPEALPQLHPQLAAMLESGNGKILLEILRRQFTTMTLLVETDCELKDPGVAVIKTRVVKLILKEEGKSEMIGYFTYLKTREKGELIYAITVAPDGKVHHIKDDAINDEPLNNEVAEYDRLHRIKFALPNAEVGSILDYAYSLTIERTDPLYPFFIDKTFLQSVPVLEQRVSIRDFRKTASILCDYDEKKFWPWPLVPQLLPPQLCEIPEIEATESSTAEWKTRTFVLGPIGGYIRDETQSPPSSHFAPELVLACENSWKNIGVEYSKALEKLSKMRGEAAGALGVSLDDASQKDIAKKAYDRIARKMKHVPVGMGSFKYVPQDPRPLVKKDLGNSLDKAHIFLGMCEQAEIPANIVLVRNRWSGPVTENVPSIRQFTTPLVRIELDGKELFCTFGSNNLRMGQLLPNLQDVKGLLIDGSNSRLITVPATQPDDQSVKKDVSVALKADGSIEVTRTSTIAGGAESGLRAMRFSPEEKVKKDMESTIGAIHPNCRYISHRFVTALDDFSRPLKIEYKYEITDYIIKGGDKLMLLHLPELSYSAWNVGRSRRRFPVYFGVASRTENKYRISLPEGFHVRYLPENIEKSIGGSSAFLYRANFEKTENTLSFEDVTRNTMMQIEPADYAQYKKLIESRARLAGKEWIILEREN